MIGLAVTNDAIESDLDTTVWELVALHAEVAAIRAEVADLQCRLGAVLLRLED